MTELKRPTLDRPINAHERDLLLWKQFIKPKRTNSFSQFIYNTYRHFLVDQSYKFSPPVANKPDKKNDFRPAPLRRIDMPDQQPLPMPVDPLPTQSLDSSSTSSESLKAAEQNTSSTTQDLEPKLDDSQTIFHSTKLTTFSQLEQIKPHVIRALEYQLAQSKAKLNSFFYNNALTAQRVTLIATTLDRLHSVNSCEDLLGELHILKDANAQLTAEFPRSGRGSLHKTLEQLLVVKKIQSKSSIYPRQYTYKNVIHPGVLIQLSARYNNQSTVNQQKPKARLSTDVTQALDKQQHFTWQKSIVIKALAVQFSATVHKFKAKTVCNFFHRKDLSRTKANLLAGCMLDIEQAETPEAVVALLRELESANEKITERNNTSSYYPPVTPGTLGELLLAGDVAQASNFIDLGLAVFLNKAKQFDQAQFNKDICFIKPSAPSPKNPTSLLGISIDSIKGQLEPMTATRGLYM